MSMLQTNGRIENINGLHFYEQDIVMLDYVYAGDIKIKTKIDFRNPGFGIVFAEYKSEDISTSNNSYLVRLGNLDWSLMQVKSDKQDKVSSGSQPIKPDIQNENIQNIVFTKSGKKLKTYLVNTEEEEIASITIPEVFAKYRIGFYSNAENTIIASDISELRPQFWFTNVENSNGGRISFKRDAILFEHGDKAMEVEQQRIKLGAGKYWLDFDVDALNNEENINYYLFPTRLGSLEIDPVKKNILAKNNSFVLDKDTEVNLLFQCKSGQVSNICIKDEPYESYVSTSGDTSETKAGSKVVVHLENITKITWNGQIDSVPYYDASSEPPYHIISYDSNRFTYSDLSILLQNEYNFSFYKDNDKWNLKIESGNTVLCQKEFDMNDEAKTMEFFYNISGYARNIIVTLLDGTEMNILLQKTYKKYVPIEIESPIIVVDESDEPFDLSSDYRYNVKTDKYIFTNWSREYYEGNSQVLFTENKILNSADSVYLYGIKDAISIENLYDITSDTLINDISQCAKRHDIIAAEYYTVSDNSIDLSEALMDMEYKYFIVDYLKSDSYAINIAEDNNGNDIYEVDIATDQTKFVTLYDMNENGQISHYKIIDNMVPNDDYFITMYKQEEGIII